MTGVRNAMSALSVQADSIDRGRPHVTRQTHGLDLYKYSLFSWCYMPLISEHLHNFVIMSAATGSTGHYKTQYKLATR